MQYKPGTDNPADYMSRHPSNKNIVSGRQEKMAEQYVNFILDSDVPTALTLEEIQSATAQGPTLQTVIKNLNTGRWQEVKETALSGANLDALISFMNIKDELYINAEQNLILKGSQTAAWSCSVSS